MASEQTPRAGWLEEVTVGLGSVTVHDLTRFQVPPDARPRRSAVLMLLADTDGDGRGELLLTERAHHMRSHPGQVSFPGGMGEEGEDPVTTALREANEEIDLDPAQVQVLGQLPELWLPPTNFAVTPVVAHWSHRGEVHAASPDEVHAVHHEDIDDLLDPENRITVRHPSGWLGPGFLVGPERDVILWGFTAGIVARFFGHLGWAREWDTSRVRELPAHMLAGEGPRTEFRQNTDLEDPL